MTAQVIHNDFIKMALKSEFSVIQEINQEKMLVKENHKIPYISFGFEWNAIESIDM